MDVPYLLDTNIGICLWIATHAKAAGLTLVTNNERVPASARAEGAGLGGLDSCCVLF